MTLTPTQLAAAAEATEEEILDDLLEVASVLGFDTSSWQSGSKRRLVLKAIAKSATIMLPLVGTLAEWVFGETAIGEALTQYCRSAYGEERVTAACTQGIVTLTASSAVPPGGYSVPIRELTVSTATGITFKNMVALTILPSTVYSSVAIEAEVAGTSGNVATGAITTVVTTYAGVTVSNPASPWITTQGTDEETDAALFLRCQAKWSSMGPIESVADRYEYVARTAVENLRVAIDDSEPDGPGTVEVWIAADDGVASAQNQTDVAAAIAAAAFGSICTVSISAAVTINIVGTIYVAAGTNPTAECEAALSAAINAAPIGGYYRGPAKPNVIDWALLLAALSSPNAVVSSIVTTPAADTTLTAYQVAVLGTVTLTLVEIP